MSAPASARGTAGKDRSKADFNSGKGRSNQTEYRTPDPTVPKDHRKRGGRRQTLGQNCRDGASVTVIAERKRHSQKPSEVRERIVKGFGDLPRIELFAREYADGWDCWGNEV